MTKIVPGGESIPTLVRDWIWGGIMRGGLVDGGNLSLVMCAIIVLFLFKGLGEGPWLLESPLTIAPCGFID